MLNLISEHYDKFKMVCHHTAEMDSTELSVHVHSRYMNANYSYLCDKYTLRKTSERLHDEQEKDVTKLNIEYSCIVAALHGLKNLGIRDITSFS